MTAHRDIAGHPLHLAAEVLDSRPAGAYRHLTLAAPGVAERARPGQFVALGVGEEGSGLLLRRAFSLHRVSEAAGTAEVVIAANGPGTRWLVGRAPGDIVDLVGPLGQPFTLPERPEPCVLVGGGYGSAPLFWLAEELRARGCAVDLVVGAANQGRLFGVDLALRCADTVAVTTDDGSAGTHGRVTDALPAVLERTGATAVFACGPMAMLRAVHAVAAEYGAAAQVAVEESMACGIGVCMTCVLPVVDDHGVTRMTRSCVEGPVFRGDRVRWDAVLAGGGCAVPADAVGAP